ncbi:SDR family NAD(P)-dependent oxidoreductase [Arthrobacter glacialis]|uniref:SDR family NAD(P)-dependent oxidoreductase n=1 Tax=Arthrobacter glacialis TaxID=1664 RepID=UPI000CD491CE|nr:hypothetical protein CVS28_05040 [Arthrobacter glacialis]
MKRVLITGASSGIGEATALLFAKKGYEIVLASRSTARLDALVESLRTVGGIAHSLACDLSTPEGCERLVPEAMSLMGGIDALVNCAGATGAHSIESSTQEVQYLINLNLIAPIVLMRDAITAFKIQGHGTIVNVGSMAGEIGIRGTYSASKFGLRGITDSVRREVAGDNINVSLVVPNRVLTSMSSGRGRGLVGAEVVAQAIERGMQRTARRIVIPRSRRLQILVEAVCPWLIDLVTNTRPTRKTLSQSD